MNWHEKESIRWHIIRQMHKGIEAKLYRHELMILIASKKGTSVSFIDIYWILFKDSILFIYYLLINNYNYYY